MEQMQPNGNSSIHPLQILYSCTQFHFIQIELTIAISFETVAWLTPQTKTSVQRAVCISTQQCNIFSFYDATIFFLHSNSIEPTPATTIYLFFRKLALI